MDLPERFRGDSDDEVDASKPSERLPETFVQQSVYGIIAAVHGRSASVLPNLQPVCASESGSGSGSDVDHAKKDDPIDASLPVDDTLSRTRSHDVQSQQRQDLQIRSASSPRLNEMGDVTSERLLGSEMTNPHNPGGFTGLDRMSQSQLLPPRTDLSTERVSLLSAATRPRSRLSGPALEVHAKTVPSDGRQQRSADRSQTPIAKREGRRHSPARSSLSNALAGIFHLESPEDIISQYACGYLQNVVLQGHMYITQQHICFYAYLPKQSHVVKSGYLSKQGKHSSRYRRYWFTLKAGVFSYYSSAAEPFFPRGTIDLRLATAAELVPTEDEDGENVTFTIATDKRTHILRAESAASAREWVRQLQKVIFRSHSDGDSVKLLISVNDIVDVESSPMLDFAETVKIRVVDNVETYAIDEYFFTFFSNGKAARHSLMSIAEANNQRASSCSAKMEKRASQTEESLSVTTPTTRPFLPAATNQSQLGSFRRQLDSLESGRTKTAGSSRSVVFESSSNITPSVDDSKDLSMASTEYAPDSSVCSGEIENDMSASQMLVGDAAFKSPTLRAPETRDTSRMLQSTTISKPRPGTGAGREDDHHGISTETGFGDLPRSSQDISEPTQLTEIDGSRTSESTVATGPLRAITAPLHHAYTLAGVVRNQSKRVGSYLSSSPKNYYDRFSGALAGGKRHYTDAGGSGPDDDVDDPELDMETAEHERRFQQHFALPPTERLRAVYYCSLHRVLPLYGKVYISDRRFCFRSLLYGTRTKLVVPFAEIDNLTKEKGFRWGYPGMVLIIRGHEELFFDFGSADARDDCVVTVLRSLDIMRATIESTILSDEEKAKAGAAAAENNALLNAHKEYDTTHSGELENNSQKTSGDTSVLFDDPNASVLDFRPKQAMRITCLTIGSRGDVQPYIALCKGLIKDGHKVKIATHAQFEGWIRSHGIDFAPVDGDPAELMRICVENGMFTPSFLYEANSKFRSWLDGLLESAWKACAGTELLIESPSAMAGIHIAEALEIPYFRAFTMPWTKTRAYPHAFAMRGKRMGGQYNYTSYTVFDYVFWQAIATQINRWRRKSLDIRPTDYTKMQSNKVPFLYNFSPSVVPPPLDFSDWIRITGYWFLDEAEGWQPPEDLVAFIEKARADGTKLVYIGFGSVPVADSKGLTRQIVDAVLNAGVRCILSKGWSDHFEQDDAATPEIVLPETIFQIRSAPHDWLFKQIDAAVHHGGAGTTGASLRAGVPTVIKPFFGDQFFFATRVEDLGVGIQLQRLTVKALGKAIWCATHDERMRTKARLLGARIRHENGVQTAITAIYRDLEYAKTLIKKRDNATSTQPSEGAEDEGQEDEEESWTFVENDSDVDVTGVRSESDILGISPVQQLQQSSISSARPSLVNPVVQRVMKDY